MLDAQNISKKQKIIFIISIMVIISLIYFTVSYLNIRGERIKKAEQILETAQAFYDDKCYQNAKLTIDEMPFNERYKLPKKLYGELEGIYVRSEHELDKREEEERLREAQKHEQETDKLIVSGKIRLGMTAEQVQQSWGKPKDINRSVGSWGVHEQWVYYGNKYLYFENDILTSWQD